MLFLSILAFHTAEEKACDKNGRIRTENWEYAHKVDLIDIIREHVNVIENKKTDAAINRKKNDAWSKVYSAFCTKHGNKRILKQLKNQWKNLKQMQKKVMPTMRKRRLRPVEALPQNHLQEYMLRSRVSFLLNSSNFIIHMMTMRNRGIAIYLRAVPIKIGRGGWPGHSFFFLGGGGGVFKRVWKLGGRGSFLIENCPPPPPSKKKPYFPALEIHKFFCRNLLIFLCALKKYDF